MNINKRIERRTKKLNKKDLIMRLISKMQINNGCWEWTGCIIRGYGYISNGTASTGVHRISYEFFKGKIANGMAIDHLCRNTKCFNPEHLEEVTPAENTKRMFLSRRKVNELDVL